MSENVIWIIKSKQTNPNDFYVRVDGSEFYIAFWVASSQSKEEALSMTKVAIAELDLGETESIEAYPYNNQFSSENNEISVKIEKLIESLNNQFDVQLAAWVPEKGGVW